MKAIILAVLIIASFASSFDEVKALVRNDKCASNSVEILKPEINIQIQKLKQVHFKIYFRTLKTQLLKLNSSPSFKKPKRSLMLVTLTKKFNQFWVMSLKPPVLDSYLPQTVSRMSEPSSSLPIQSLKTHLMLPTMSSSLSSSLFQEDKPMLTVKLSSNSSSEYDCSFNFINFKNISFFQILHKSILKIMGAYPS